MNSPQPPARKLSLGVIFLTLYIDLVGFSIIFPLLPDLLHHYLSTEGHSGLLGYLYSASVSAAHLVGNKEGYAEVLFGGVVASLFSVLQFLLSPFWGGLSDRRGRRPVLLWTVAGTAFGYLVWVFSGSFWLFVVSRAIGGIFGGNISVATAAVADVTSRQERTKAMGLVGAAFGLGLVTGPMIGALAMRFNPLAHCTAFGLNVFSFPALLSLILSLINVIWIARRFAEPLDQAHRQRMSSERIRNPLKAIYFLSDPIVRRINLISFIHSLAFVSLEVTLTYLAADRFHYNAKQNGMLLAFLGVCSILTQGVLVRRLLKPSNENTVLATGLAIEMLGLLGIAFAFSSWLLYLGIALAAVGAGFVNPSTSGLISLHSSPAEQGKAIGVFRSLGALARAITPIVAGLVYWSFSALSLYVAGAVVALVAFTLAVQLPKPVR